MNNQSRLSLLDGLRLIAAVSVVLYHIHLSANGLGVFSRGYLFVDFFFLLSGFVLTLAAEDRMNAKDGALRFLRARVARLWPIIAVGALTGALLRMIETGQSVRMLLVQAMLLMPNVRPNSAQGGLIFPLNGPHWSMMLEILANTAHLLVIRRLSDRMVLAVAGLGGTVLAVSIFLFGSATFGPDSSNWWMGFARIGFSYPCGVWLARQWKNTPPDSIRTSSGLPWYVALTLPLSALMVLPALPLNTAIGDALVILLLFPPLLWLAASATPPAFAGKWLRAAGLLSFPLYAVHLPILEYVGGLHLGPLGPAIAIAAALLAAALVAQIPPIRAIRPFPRLRNRSTVPLP
ncbi:acyltransferase [Novosphingobium sp.]|uniref:acyltransferase family protein n=1 Tax=Novosphingobium sp. TaxID=1874826 RepID=UPI0025EAC3E0|nr:acyltransferase [Novosphingobium sp.]